MPFDSSGDSMARDRSSGRSTSCLHSSVAWLLVVEKDQAGIAGLIGVAVATAILAAIGRGHAPERIFSIAPAVTVDPVNVVVLVHQAAMPVEVAADHGLTAMSQALCPFLRAVAGIPTLPARGSCAILPVHDRRRRFELTELSRGDVATFGIPT